MSRQCHADLRDEPACRGIAPLIGRSPRAGPGHSALRSLRATGHVNRVGEGSQTERPRHAEIRRKAMTETTSPRSHVPRLVLTEHVHARVHGTGPLGRLNAAVAVRITKIVGTMYCAYVFTLVALVALPAAIQQGSPTVLVNWLSSNFLQLVLLPIIIAGQNVISAAHDARAEADHETLTALHQMSLQQIDILEGQNQILDLLRQKAG